MARPEKPIDWEFVDELLIAGCIGTEIAPHFDMHPDTFYHRVQEKYNICFTAYSLQKKSQGDSLLRKVQFDKALNSDTSMLIWLGKNRLNQKDRDMSREIEDIKADLSRLCDGLALGRERHAEEQLKDHSSSRVSVIPD